MIIQVIGAFFATLFFCIIFNISKKQLLFCGINGAIGWLVYLLTLNMHSIVLSTFLGALVVSIIAHILSKVRKTPVTVYLIAGVIPLVPGAILYKAIYNIVIQDYDMSSFYGIQSIELACAIAVAVFLVASVTKSSRRTK